MCVTLMVSSLITTLYVQRQWLSTKISKLVKFLIPAKTTTLVCTEREQLEGKEALKITKAEEDESGNGVVVMELVENLEDFEKYITEPFRTGPSMVDMNVTCRCKLD